MMTGATALDGAERPAIEPGLALKAACLNG